MTKHWSIMKAQTTTDTRTKKNGNKGKALEQPVEKKNYFYIFPLKIGSDTACKLSPVS